MYSSSSLTRRSLLLLLVAVGALGLGVYARFKGLGAAPLSVDEYYLTRSIDNVIRSGLPAFKCGGFYTRGLIQQYLSAGLRLEGMAPELAPRLIAALCSLLVLPAAYLLGRRVHGRTVGLLAVTVLALSVWEIEMARFGRMYAPFQALSAWYLVFFVRYVVDREARALWPMLALSLIGPLVWEGGALLALANFLPIFLRPDPEKRPSGSDWIYLGGAMVLFAAAYWFVTADFRGYNAASWPASFSRAMVALPHDPMSALTLPLLRLPYHPWWAALAIVPLIGALVALRRIWAWRQRPLAAAGLLALLLAAMLQQFAAMLAIALLLLLMRLVHWRELFGKAATALLVAVLLCAAYWLAFGVATTDWHTAASTGLAKAIAAFAYPYLRYPDVVGVVLRPWARAVPLLGSGLLLLIGGAMWRQCRSEEPMTAERALQVVFLVLLLAASASNPPRQETRYVFFLYPLAIVIALTAIVRVSQFVLQRRPAALSLGVILGLGGFALSEDFQPHHLLHIDRPSELFRVGMRHDMQDYLEMRDDYRELSRWLQQHAVPGRDLVINGVHGLDYYDSHIDYFFADQHDPNFASWSCRQGSVERWGNYPLIYSMTSLKATIMSSQETYLVVFAPDSTQMLASLADLNPHIVWAQGYVDVIALQGSR